MFRAPVPSMGAKHFTELRAWQLANRLRIEVYRLTDIAPAKHDRRFCDAIRSSSSSVCSNIAEGFGRRTHPEFAQFVTIGRGSLTETQDHLIDAQNRGYVDPAKFTELWALSEETMKAVDGLLNYLLSHPTPDFAARASRHVAR